VLLLSSWLASSAGGVVLSVVVLSVVVLVDAEASALAAGVSRSAETPALVSAVLAQAASSNAASALAANAPERSDGFMAMSSVREDMPGHGHAPGMQGWNQLPELALAPPRAAR
jgi:hypothetical protein